MRWRGREGRSLSQLSQKTNLLSTRQPLNQLQDARSTAKFRNGRGESIQIWSTRSFEPALLGEVGPDFSHLVGSRRTRWSLVSSNHFTRSVSFLFSNWSYISFFSSSLDFCLSQSITLHRLGALYGSNAWDPITEEVVLSALNLLVQPSTYPVLVMCNLGRHRTGTVIGCLRKLQRWNLSAILDEYRRYAGPKVRVMNEQVSTSEV